MGAPRRYYDDSDTSDSDEAAAIKVADNSGTHAVISSTNGTGSVHDEEDRGLEDVLHLWKRSLPTTLKPGGLNYDELVIFLSRALHLVDSGEEHMETVIISLASEGGLTRLRELVGRNFNNFTDAKLSRVWADLLLVYFKIMCHDTVLASKTVDHRHDILMSDLYGDHGKRASLVFKTAVRALTTEAQQKGVAGHTHQENIKITIAVFSCMLRQTDWRNITAELCAIADSVLSLLDSPDPGKQTDQRVLCLRTHLENARAAQHGAVHPTGLIAQSAPEAVVTPISETNPGPSRPQAGPGVIARRPAPSTFILTKPSNKPQQSGGTRKLKAHASAVPDAPSTLSGPLRNLTVVAQAPFGVTSDPTTSDRIPTFGRHDNDKQHIADISIMPTLEEIMCDKPPYLPREDPSVWHKSGLHAVIDHHFRLVREDTVGQLRIALKAELEALQNYNSCPRPTSIHSVAEVQGARTNVYTDVSLDEVCFNEQKGMQFILSLSQPPAVLRARSAPEREAWWKHEQRLGPDSLICLLSSEGGAHFMVVHNPPPPKPGKTPNPNALHKRYTLWMRKERAFVIAELASTKASDGSALLRTLANKGTSKKVRLCLIEFPGQILQSFAPTLAALQIMSRRVSEIPFADALTPDFKGFQPSSPAYARAKNFAYSLQALLPESERGRNVRQTLDSFLKRSVLDDGQQDAVKHALTNEMALIQGPPGTGKSFTGVKLIEALLENKESANLGPVVCVCYTNHALDQLLEHLLDAGVGGVIRMGSRSKSERLAPLNIREVAQNYGPVGPEGSQMGRAKKQIKKAVRNIRALLDRWCGVLTKEDGEDAEITTTLERDYPALHEQLLAGSTMRGHFALSPVQEWLKGGSGSQTPQKNSTRSAERGSMFAMANAERKKFHQTLLSSIFDDLYSELEIELQLFYDHKDTIEAVRGEVDLRALSNADVIGVTTSGLAGKYKRLRKLRAKVVVVEEAGEVLEAHLLTAMLPSVQHAILIGDHQQLRPKVNNYNLSIDNPASKITLDRSLFERLIIERFDTTPGLPYKTLEIQRRMHPSISSLIRSTLYPNLGDAPNVQSYPPVAGMAKRLFWLDHRNKEDDTRGNPQSVSQSNKWEVSMVAALVGHLQKQGAYSAGEIAVLTPYSGQLKELQARLGSTFGIMLSERDLDDGIQATGSRNRSRTAIRLSTVDAFQGEEAKVVIISMVRSNENKICGFLGTTNRINVLLSRAMHGMYIIGNSYTTSEVAMWQDVVSLLKAEGNFGPALEIACGRHPNSKAPVLVREPRDFSRVSSQAGCNAQCGEKLPCGHLCSEKCHSDAMHKRVKCEKQCGRLSEICGHRCEKACGEECEANCKSLLPCDITLPCGHHLAEMYCFQQRQKISAIRCTVEVERYMPACGHRTALACYLTTNHARFCCKEVCEDTLACGHTCDKDCIDCRPRGSVNVDHGSCVQKCGREYSGCDHRCSKPCHEEDAACPPCSAACQSHCTHVKCDKRCGDLCLPCTNEQCTSKCPHSVCTMLCAAPCDWVPCSKRCKEKLKCGHPCPSICGEICPSAESCQRCGKDEFKGSIVDPLAKLTYEDVEDPCLFPICGHIFTLGVLDRHMEMAKIYEMDDYRGTSYPAALKGDVPAFFFDKPKSCPTCQGSLHTISRYGRIVRRALLDEKIQHFLESCRQAYDPLAKVLQDFKKSLPRTLDHGFLLSDVSLGIAATESSQKSRFINPYQSVLKSTGARYIGVLALRLKIRDLVEKSQREELPFRKIREMVGTTARQQDTAYNSDQSIKKTSAALLNVQMLLVHCELLVANDLVALWELKRPNQKAKLLVNFSKNRKYCDELLVSAVELQDIHKQAEAHVYWVHFLALDCAARAHDAEQ